MPKRAISPVLYTFTYCISYKNNPFKRLHKIINIKKALQWLFFLKHLHYIKKSLIFAIVIEIDKHIEILLLDNECVIIPGFGGFTSHYVSARYDDRDNMFLPPIRTIGFNPQLRLNDSLLVQSYVECYDISYPEALKKIEAEVDSLKAALNSKGEYSFSDIGTIILNNDGNYQFIPCESGLLTPELYGLSAYEIKTQEAFIRGLNESKAIETKNIGSEVAEKIVTGAASPLATSFVNTEITPKEKEEPKELNTKRYFIYNVIRNIAATLLTIVVLFLVSSPLDNNKQPAISSGGIDTNLLYKVLPKNVSTIPSQLRSTALPTDPKASTTESNKEITEAKEKQPSSYYALVLASKVSKANANAFTKLLYKNGYEEAEVIITKHNVKVVFGHYTTENEAYRMVNKLRGLKYFEDCWVTRIRQS